MRHLLSSDSFKSDCLRYRWSQNCFLRAQQQFSTGSLSHYAIGMSSAVSHTWAQAWNCLLLEFHMRLFNHKSDTSNLVRRLVLIFWNSSTHMIFEWFIKLKFQLIYCLKLFLLNNIIYHHPSRSSSSPPACLCAWPPASLARTLSATRQLTASPVKSLAMVAQWPVLTAMLMPMVITDRSV